MPVEPLFLSGVAEFARKPSEGGCNTPVSRFRVEAADAVEPSATAWLVKDLWPAVGVAFLGGPSGSGKSFLALYMAAQIAAGQPVLNRKARRAGVIYVAAEGAAGVRKRIKGMRKQRGAFGSYFNFIGQAPNLTDPADFSDLCAALADAKRQLEERGVALGVVAIDTLSATIPGADENSAQDMSRVLADLQMLASDLGVLVLVVAHTGKDESRGLRGWSGLFANADGVIMLDDPKGEQIRTGTIVKVKDGPAGDTFAFELEQISLGQDADGDAITTCVVHEVEAVERRATGRRPTKAGASGELIMRAYGRVFDVKPQAVNAPGAVGNKGVLVRDLRTQSYAIGLGPSEPDFSELGDAEEQKRAKRSWHDKRKIDFDRGLQHLAAKGFLRVEDGLVWEPRPPSRTMGNNTDHGEPK